MRHVIFKRLSFILFLLPSLAFAQGVINDSACGHPIYNGYSSTDGDIYTYGSSKTLPKKIIYSKGTINKLFGIPYSVEITENMLDAGKSQIEINFVNTPQGNTAQCYADKSHIVNDEALAAWLKEMLHPNLMIEITEDCKIADSGKWNSITIEGTDADSKKSDAIKFNVFNPKVSILRNKGGVTDSNDTVLDQLDSYLLKQFPDLRGESLSDHGEVQVDPIVTEHTENKKNHRAKRKKHGNAHRK